MLIEVSQLVDLGCEDGALLQVLRASMCYDRTKAKAPRSTSWSTWAVGMAPCFKC